MRFAYQIINNKYNTRSSSSSNQKAADYLEAELPYLLRGLQNNKRGPRSSIQWAGNMKSSHRGSGRGHGDGFHRLPMQHAQGHLGGHVLRVFLSEPTVLHGTWA